MQQPPLTLLCVLLLVFACVVPVFGACGGEVGSGASTSSTASQYTSTVKNSVQIGIQAWDIIKTVSGADKVPGLDILEPILDLVFPSDDPATVKEIEDLLRAQVGLIADMLDKRDCKQQFRGALSDFDQLSQLFMEGGKCEQVQQRIEIQIKQLKRIPNITQQQLYDPLSDWDKNCFAHVRPFIEFGSSSKTTDVFSNLEGGPGTFMHMNGVRSWSATQLLFTGLNLHYLAREKWIQMHQMLWSDASYPGEEADIIAFRHWYQQHVTAHQGLTLHVAYRRRLMVSRISRSNTQDDYHHPNSFQFGDTLLGFSDGGRYWLDWNDPNEVNKINGPLTETDQAEYIVKAPMNIAYSWLPSDSRYNYHQTGPTSGNGQSMQLTNHRNFVGNRIINFPDPLWPRVGDYQVAQEFYLFKQAYELELDESMKRVFEERDSVLCHPSREWIMQPATWGNQRWPCWHSSHPVIRPFSTATKQSVLDHHDQKRETTMQVTDPAMSVTTLQIFAVGTQSSSMAEHENKLYMATIAPATRQLEIRYADVTSVTVPQQQYLPLAFTWKTHSISSIVAGASGSPSLVILPAGDNTEMCVTIYVEQQGLVSYCYAWRKDSRQFASTPTDSNGKRFFKQGFQTATRTGSGGISQTVHQQWIYSSFVEWADNALWPTAVCVARSRTSYNIGPDQVWCSSQYSGLMFPVVPSVLVYGERVIVYVWVRNTVSQLSFVKTDGTAEQAANWMDSAIASMDGRINVILDACEKEPVTPFTYKRRVYMLYSSCWGGVRRIRWLRCVNCESNWMSTSTPMRWANLGNPWQDADLDGLASHMHGRPWVTVSPTTGQVFVGKIHPSDKFIRTVTAAMPNDDITDIPDAVMQKPKLWCNWASSVYSIIPRANTQKDIHWGRAGYTGVFGWSYRVGIRQLYSTFNCGGYPLIPELWCPWVVKNYNIPLGKSFGDREWAWGQEWEPFLAAWNNNNCNKYATELPANAQKEAATLMYSYNLGPSAGGILNGIDVISEQDIALLESADAAEQRRATIRLAVTVTVSVAGFALVSVAGFAACLVGRRRHNKNKNMIQRMEQQQQHEMEMQANPVANSAIAIDMEQQDTSTSTSADTVPTPAPAPASASA